MNLAACSTGKIVWENGARAILADGLPKARIEFREAEQCAIWGDLRESYGKMARSGNAKTSDNPFGTRLLPMS
jgi:hypothetical protein